MLEEARVDDRLDLGLVKDGSGSTGVSRVVLSSNGERECWTFVTLDSERDWDGQME